MSSWCIYRVTENSFDRVQWPILGVHVIRTFGFKGLTVSAKAVLAGV